jgi:hypothetical protein
MPSGQPAGRRRYGSVVETHRRDARAHISRLHWDSELRYG